MKTLSEQMEENVLKKVAEEIEKTLDSERWENIRMIAEEQDLTPEQVDSIEKYPGYEKYLKGKGPIKIQSEPEEEEEDIYDAVARYRNDHPELEEASKKLWSDMKYKWTDELVLGYTEYYSCTCAPLEPREWLEREIDSQTKEKDGA